MSEVVPVALGERSYDIHVGVDLIERGGALIKPFARGAVPVVTDQTVAKLHLDRLLNSLRGTGIDARPVIIAPGEGSKTFATLESLLRTFLGMNVDRNGLIVAFGGGVVGDLAGFAAGVLKRGVGYAQIPTTLLAQVDSSVGGKTAVDMPEGKNLVGVFHQPKIVLADTALLRTLPRRDLLAGYAEVVKYGALGDAEFFAWLEKNAAQALSTNQESLAYLVGHSCRMKAAIVAADERESGQRALLNLGHTFGHAIEAACGYSDRLLHGEAVAIGTVLAFRLSQRLGHCAPSDTDRLVAHLKAVGLPVRIADVPGDAIAVGDILAHMKQDKKARDGKLTFVLVRQIGEAFLSSDVPADAVEAVLAE